MTLTAWKNKQADPVAIKKYTKDGVTNHLLQGDQEAVFFSRKKPITVEEIQDTKQFQIVQIDKNFCVCKKGDSEILGYLK